MTRSTLNLLANALSITASTYPNDSDLKQQILTTIKAAGGASAADIAAVSGLRPIDRPLLNLLANALSVTASSYPNDDALAAQIVTTIKAAGGATAADIAAVSSLN